MIFIVIRAIKRNGDDWYDYCAGLPSSATLEEIIAEVRARTYAGYELSKLEVKYPPLDTNSRTEIQQLKTRLKSFL